MLTSHYSLTQRMISQTSLDYAKPSHFPSLEHQELIMVATDISFRNFNFSGIISSIRQLSLTQNKITQVFTWLIKFFPDRFLTCGSPVDNSVHWSPKRKNLKLWFLETYCQGLHYTGRVKAVYALFRHWHVGKNLTLCMSFQEPMLHYNLSLFSQSSLEYTHPIPYPVAVFLSLSVFFSVLSFFPEFHYMLL